ncbi:macro domain-containing protein [Desulfonatronospira sp.]|uniref:macro domain-containing protein n=1 Tax=Desulfonatronospira sp. TaxID=1962951 RepID=UPI0025B85436|nr:macro domain-containing protein [Desulfonatronospira sp.]
MQKSIHGVTLECIQGDIASQDDITAVVNAANSQLRSGGGVAGALHQKAGPGLEEECRPLAPIRPGEAVLTGGHNLPSRYVIHCLGPVYGVDKPEDELLARCYKRALALAEEHHVDSIAFPAISSGAFGFPLDKAAQVALKTVGNAAPGLRQVKKVRFVLFSQEQKQAFEQVLSSVEGT